MAHYDYWSDSLRRSILLESGADLVSYGMGERSIVAIADALDAGMPVKDITYIPGTVCKVRSLDEISDYTVLPDYESICKDKKKYAESFYIQYSNTDPFFWKTAGGALFSELFYRAEPGFRTADHGRDGSGL